MNIYKTMQKLHKLMQELHRNQRLAFFDRRDYNGLRVAGSNIPQGWVYPIVDLLPKDAENTIGLVEK
jgi:hypothetical protein